MGTKAGRQHYCHNEWDIVTGVRRCSWTAFPFSQQDDLNGLFQPK